MRYESTTGLDHDQIEELVARIGQIMASAATGRGRPTTLGLYQSVLVTLVLLRQNLSQTLVADWFGVSQIDGVSDLPAIPAAARTGCRAGR